MSKRIDAARRNDREIPWPDMPAPHDCRSAHCGRWSGSLRQLGRARWADRQGEEVMSSAALHGLLMS